jgi:hypothetical protein
MKPWRNVSLRDLFWLTLVIALALGWAIDRDRLRVDYNEYLNAVRYAEHREDELRRAIQGEDYIARWDEQGRKFVLTKTTSAAPAKGEGS